MPVRLGQFFLIAIPVILLGWLLNQELVPSGTFLVHHEVGTASPFIDRLLPDARLDAEGSIVDDPVFFFVHPHRHFDTVEAKIWFKNNGAPILELGALGNVETQAYDLKPLQNQILDQLAWFRVREGDLILYQKDLGYESVADFLASPPDVAEIATYHTSLETPYLLDGYASSSTSRVIDVSLRGSHEFKTYIKDETLSFDFVYMDMNRDEGADAITLVVTNAAGDPVADARASDDGNSADDARSTGLQRFVLTVPGLPEGVYKIQMQSSRDIFWRTITTTQQKAVFLNTVFLADEVGYKPEPRSIVFWTEAKNLSFATRHVEGLQSVTSLLSSGPPLVIDEPYKRFEYEVGQNGVVPIETEAGDLEVTADGHVAFSPDMYFNPDPVRVGAQTDLDRLGVNYVLARYVPPEQQGEWSVARATFDTDSMVFEKGAWKFVFSVPDIAAAGGFVTIKEINMTWTRNPFVWNDVYEFLAGNN